MINIEFITKSISFFISIVGSLIYKMKGLNKRSIENIKKRFEIYEKIITYKQKNKHKHKKGESPCPM